MANLAYIDSIEKNRKHSLFNWVKQNPKKHISDLIKDSSHTPDVPTPLLKRAERFLSWFNKYPGDGVLFFHDDLLSPLSEVNAVYPGNNFPKEYNLFFNYMYSFKDDFNLRSCGALAVFLLNCPFLTIPLYKYRKNFDAKAFTEIIDKIVIFNSFPEYLEGDAKKYITQFLWNTILSCKVPLNVCDNNVFLHLYYAYTFTALKRFFFLSTSRAALKEHIMTAYNRYRETCLLLNCWQPNFNRTEMPADEDRMIVQMSSIKAMERFHDFKNQEIIKEQRKLDTCRYRWKNLSEIIREVSPEWYLPEFASDIRLRGQQHHNCVGGYVERHYKPVQNDFKMLLLFTDFCEAEVHIYFKEIIDKGKAYKGCTDVKILQAKTAYNKEIPQEDLSELKKVIKALKKLPEEYFNPELIPLDSNQTDESTTPL